MTFQIHVHERRAGASISVIGWAAPVWRAGDSACAVSGYVQAMSESGPCSRGSVSSRGHIRLNGTGQDRFRPVGKIQARTAPPGSRTAAFDGLDKVFRRRPGTTDRRASTSAAGGTALGRCTDRQITCEGSSLLTPPLWERAGERASAGAKRRRHHYRISAHYSVPSSLHMQHCLQRAMIGRPCKPSDQASRHLSLP